MKEIVILAGLLGVVFLVLWSIIAGLETVVKRKKEKGGGEKKKEEEVKKEDMVPVIVASIAAYEEEGERRKRERYERKGEGVSWWRVSGRTK